MATRMQQRRGTEAQWTSANPVLAAGEIGFEIDTNKFKIGDGINQWDDLSYFLDTSDLEGSFDDYIPLTQRAANNGVATLDAQGKIPLAQLGNVIDGAPDALNTLNEIAAAIGDNADFITGFNTLNTTVGTLNTDVGTLSTTVGTLTTDLGDANDNVTQLISDVESINESISDLQLEKAPLAGPTFTGTVVLPNTTSIGDVSSTEIGYVNGVTSAIQTQLDSKLASATASTTYATLAGPTFTGTVVLPNTTSIGTVDATELAYVNGVTSAIQTQLDAKAPTADPTFTGTVSGVTKTHVGLGNVDNTTDANKPVSTATQTALDAKLALAGGTLTGALTLSGAPTSDLHAATKQYVDGLAAGINFHQPVVAATTGNLAGTYNNGTNGLGATLTRASNGAIGTIDGATVSVGSRILLRAQTDKKENGVYTVTAVGSGSAPWVITRATDADNNPAGELSNGDFVFTTSGSTNGSKGFIVSTTGTITIGTTEIEYAQFNASEAVIAGTNIVKDGATISVSPTLVIGGTGAIVIQEFAAIQFTDGNQTKAGVPSITSIAQQTSSYTLSNPNERDTIVEVNSTSGTTLTIPADSDVNYPVGTTLDIIQTNTGQVTVAGAAGVTVNATPGLKLRTRWSSATLLKRAANTWLVYGDLTA
jgi:hypothetical protein